MNKTQMIEFSKRRMKDIKDQLDTETDEKTRAELIQSYEKYKAFVDQYEGK